MKKYIIRAFKYLLYFIVIFIIIVLILYLIREDRTQTLATMFEPGAFWKIGILFVGIAAIYPAIGYKKQRLEVSGGLMKNRQTIIDTLDLLDYVPAGTEANATLCDTLRFRCKKGGLRLSRMNEDGVTLTEIEGSDEFEIEGLRREVYAVAKALENKFYQDKCDGQDGRDEKGA